LKRAASALSKPGGVLISCGAGEVIVAYQKPGNGVVHLDRRKFSKEEIGVSMVGRSVHVADRKRVVERWWK
jgi:hypothetical protein